MRKETRCTLSCVKTLPSGHREMFERVVLLTQRDVVRKNYESMGYTVTFIKK